MTDQKPKPNENGSESEAPAPSLLDPIAEKQLSERQQRARTKLVQALAAQKCDSLDERVCWILNNYPSTRDNDIDLTTRYWAVYQSELIDDKMIRITDLHRLTRETSLVRSRAKIQNQFKLFQPSYEVQVKRHQKQAQEYDRHVETMGQYPSWTVYSDETGKTGEHLVVGSLWFLDSFDVAKVHTSMVEWREQNGIDYELHFAEAKRDNASLYIQAFEILRTKAATATFRYISVPRKGLKPDDALRRLFFHLIVNAVDHAQASGRAILPRTITVFKDKESSQEGVDELLLADLKKEIEAHSAVRWNRQLRVNAMEAVDSKGDYLMQLADIFTGAVNRTINRDQTTAPNHKDTIANSIMDSLGLLTEEIEFDGDLAARISL